jgi:hypothetical protein
VEPSCTKNALSDLVVPAIDEEKSTLLGTQNTRPTTIEMTEKPVAEDDGVLRRERLTTLRADPRLLFHPDSRQQAGCQRAMPARLREITGDARLPVEEGRNCRSPWKNDTAANSTGRRRTYTSSRREAPSPFRLEVSARYPFGVSSGRNGGNPLIDFHRTRARDWMRR